MKKNLMLLITVSFTVAVFAQNRVRFQIEKLTPPTAVLPTGSETQAWKNILYKDLFWKKSKLNYGDPALDSQYKIVSHSKTNKPVVTAFGRHPFFDGMLEAYISHRPFVISPDMIWLLISQGFSQHVNANAEQMRDLLVAFEGKRTLLVLDTVKINSNLIEESWARIMPKFTAQIKANVKSGLVDMLTADFSTTGVSERIASQITIMKTFEQYFVYRYAEVGCGIPELTILGTAEDWRKIVDKTKQMSAYKLYWWTSELIPLLNQFVRVVEGKKPNKAFWRDMFKYHTSTEYGSPKVIDGWIVKFFPYDKHGKQLLLGSLSGSENLPSEVVTVDFFYDVYSDAGECKSSTLMELWAGFVAVEQNESDFTLTPKIGWMIREKFPQPEAKK